MKKRTIAWLLSLLGWVAGLWGGGAAAAEPGTTAVLRWLHRADSVADTSPTLARAWQDSARWLAHRQRLPRLEVRALLACGASAAEQADYPAAGAAAHQAWVLARRLGTPSAEELKALELLNSIAFSRDRFAEAIGYARQVLAVAQALGNDTLLVAAANDLGNGLSESHQYREAEKWLLRGQAGYHRLHNRRGESVALVNLSVNELYQHRLPTAQAYAVAALHAARQQPDSIMVSNALSARVRVYLEQGRSDIAVTTYEYAVQLAEATGKPSNVLLMRDGLGQVYEQAGRLGDALAAERRYTVLMDSFNSADVNRQMAELNTRFRVGQQQARIGALTQQQRIGALRADHERSRSRLWSTAALGLAALLLLGGVLYRQLRRSRARLAASETGLRTANATKDQLMRIIGHDLRGPLATFQQLAPLFAELADAPDAAEQHLLAQALDNRARAVGTLVDNLLDWSRAQTGQVAAWPQPVRLAVLAQSLQALFGPVAAAKPVQLVVQVADGLPRTLHTDPNLLGAILRNLLGNALRFTPGGGTVTLSLAAAARGVVLSVADTGPGMPAGKLAAALAGAAVGSTAGTGGERGTGLGLAVCHHFASLLEATWTGNSAPGQGTCWELHLHDLPAGHAPQSATVALV